MRARLQHVALMEGIATAHYFLHPSQDFILRQLYKAVLTILPQSLMLLMLVLVLLPPVARESA